MPNMSNALRRARSRDLSKARSGTDGIGLDRLVVFDVWCIDALRNRVAFDVLGCRADKGADLSAICGAIFECWKPAGVWSLRRNRSLIFCDNLAMALTDARWPGLGSRRLV